MDSDIAGIAVAGATRGTERAADVDFSIAGHINVAAIALNLTSGNQSSAVIGLKQDFAAIADDDLAGQSVFDTDERVLVRGIGHGRTTTSAPAAALVLDAP